MLEPPFLYGYISVDCSSDSYRPGTLASIDLFDFASYGTGMWYGSYPAPPLILCEIHPKKHELDRRKEQDERGIISIRTVMRLCSFFSLFNIYSLFLIFR